MINKRLAYFSDNKVNNYAQLFDPSISAEELEKIFELANSNPRDILHIFKTIFDEQYHRNSCKIQIEKESIRSALMKFVTNFNYYEYYPRKSNARADSMDVYSYCSFLLKLENKEFTKNQLNERAKLGGSLQNYVTGMERIGLIENIRSEKGIVYYRIKDAKIIFALEQGLEIKK